jgi:glycosyltransferase involved in cell wall biosynthesis
MLKKAQDLNLDIAHFYSPSTIGMFAVYLARKCNIKLIGQHCTDICEYLDKYPVLKPAVFVMSILLPLAASTTSEQKKRIIMNYIPKLKRKKKWSLRTMEDVLVVLYSMCDSVVAVSKKSKEQLALIGIPSESIEVIPTGINALPSANSDQIEEFRSAYNLQPSDEVIVYVGRLAVEKNLEILFPMFEEVKKVRPNAKLLLVGDNEYRPFLEKIAQKSSCSDSIIFTGKMPREELDITYKISKCFVFPSLTDTQGLVLHEAAGGGLPIVLTDAKISEVLIDGENGYVTDPDPTSLASAVIKILEDLDLQKRFSSRSKVLASQFTEEIQCGKQVALYNELIPDTEGRTPDICTP